VDNVVTLYHPLLLISLYPTTLAVENTTHTVDDVRGPS